MKKVLLLRQQWCVLLLFLRLATAASPPHPPPPISMHGCPDKCGNESVPYPFGFGRRECFKSDLFELNCTYDDKDKKYKLSKGDFEIVNISMETGTATFYIPMLYSCYNRYPGEVSYSFWLGNSNSAFTFSSKRNKFTALGCNTKAMILDSQRNSFMTGCLSTCYNKVNLTDEDGGGSCSGIGCCRTQIPKGFKRLHMSLETEFNLAREFSPCAYAFLADQDWNGFTSIDLTDTFNVNRTSPVAVDWVVGKETCESFSMNPSTNACGVNTNCNNSYNGPGYFCSCKQGYQGNPYHGCQDIDECKDPKTHNCAGTCKNTGGSFTCHCPLGTHVDDKGACKGFRLTTLAGESPTGIIDGCYEVRQVQKTSSSHRKAAAPQLNSVRLGTRVSVFHPALMNHRLYKALTGKLRSNKARNFSKNGGTLLKNQEIEIYKEEELKKATKNYNHDQLLGKGGSGFVYKGELLNKELVAIKKPKVDPDIARGGIGQYFRSRVKLDHNFLNEIRMICSVNHKNVVKLKGLCLETYVPLLVYEFVPNDSLYHHIHSAHSSRLNSWKNRLRIACDTAVALDYLHSMARTTPIIHGDVKSKNILLDENFTPKVADFGASVLVPLKQNSFSVTKVQGTRGYLDPEYKTTGRLTVKSDVYSFGVVLMELLTSQKPISEQRSLEKVDYIPYFVLSVENENFRQVIDYGRLGDKDQEMKLQVEVVAKLAVKCLNRSSLGRPDMAEVVKKLGKLNARNSGVRVDQSNNIIEEKESMVRDHHDHSVDCSDNIPMLSCSSYTDTQYMTAFDEIQQNPSS
ncbi:hypothetical protein LguiA_008461 [Lonicera macranthoides]